MQNARRYSKHNEYQFTEHEIFHDRYVFGGEIGRGAFGQVFRAIDRLTHGVVAIKIFRADPAVERHAKQEVEILTTINAKDDQATPTTVRLLDQFMHGEHICIVLEMLSMNLYELVQSNGECGLPLPLIRSFGSQITRALRFYSSSDIRLLHSDIKPENILLVNPTSARIKIIDFGGSSFDHFKPFTYIQSRHYRSPEILLGIKYSTPIDMWSLGCVLVELFTGVPLFPGRNEKEVMWEIVEVLGMPPQPFLFLSKRSTHYFERGPDMKWRHNPSKTKKIEKARPLELVIKDAMLDFSAAFPGCPAPSEAEISNFIHLVGSMLQFEPEKRITPEQALAHPFFATREAESAELLSEITQLITQPNHMEANRPPSSMDYEAASSSESAYTLEAGSLHASQGTFECTSSPSITSLLPAERDEFSGFKKQTLPLMPAVLKEVVSMQRRTNSSLRVLTSTHSSTEREIAINSIIASTPSTPSAEHYVPSPSDSHHSDDSVLCNPPIRLQLSHQPDRSLHDASTI